MRLAKERDAMETPIISQTTAPVSEPIIEPTTSAMERVLARLNIGAVHHVWHDLKPRIISSLIMVTVFLLAVILGGAVFGGLIMVVAMLMIREWDFLVADKDAKWGWYGIGYIALACASIMWLRSISTETSPHAGMGLVFYLVCVVISTDVCAYFVGKRVGRTKLAPDISPGKTWEGLAGGVAGAGLAGLLCAGLTPFPYTTAECVILAMLLAFVAQAGDLFESHLKRQADVKDSGTLIKGHGGVLDRLDGMLSTAPVFAFMVLLSGLN